MSVLYFVLFLSHTRLDLSLVFVQKFKFILMKIHKKLLPPELLLLAQICTKSFVDWGLIHLQTPLREHTALPQPSSWFRGWGPRERKGGRGGGKGGTGRDGGDGRERERRESRNAQIQSWQTYRRNVGGVLISLPFHRPLSP